MKVLAINGSPHRDGNTAAALEIVAQALREEGIEVETVQVGHLPVRPCIDCRACKRDPRHRCAFDDIVNEVLDKAQDCDGFLFGSPTYYAGIAGAMKSFLDRLFFTGGLPKYKVGLAVAAVRRTGGLDVVYGGGLKTDNAEMLASIDEIDGGLIALTRFTGEIGWYPDEYLEIIRTYLGK